MNIIPIKSNNNRHNTPDNAINKTLKGVLINNHIKSQNDSNISFDEIHDSLLITDTKNQKKEIKDNKEEESSFNIKKAIKPLLLGTIILSGSIFGVSAILKKSSQKLISSKSFEQLPDLAVNMNIKEETHFALYRAIRNPSYKNVLGASAVFLMSGITIACKNFIDGAKEIWLKKQSADIEKNLQENLIKVETDSFSGKLSFVNELMNKNVKHFKDVLNKENISENANIFKGFTNNTLPFKGHQQLENNEDKNKKSNKDLKYLLLSVAVIGASLMLGKFSFSNLKKTAQNTQKFADNYTEQAIETIKKISENADKNDLSKVEELLKSICAKPEFIKDIGKKYKLNPEEIENITSEVLKSKKTIFADAPTALGGIPKKIQYYCYLDENRGHLYNWILNPENKFTKYIFSAFTISSAAGYLFKQAMDALKDVTVLKENAKTELNLRKRLVDVEISNFKSKKESAINPLMENFDKEAKEGKKTKEELKQLADNILSETKNGPPYVYT